MVVIGSDVHKRTHTFVAVNGVGQQVAELTVEATTAGHGKAIRWAARFVSESGEQVVWAIEDCRNMSARLERDLLGHGASVVRVPPHMAARHRKIGRARGKSDPIDALAVAYAALRENLPAATHDEVSQDARWLTDRRETLVANRTRAINSLRDRVHQIDPAIEPKLRTLNQDNVQRRLMAALTGVPGVQAEIARDELVEVVDLTVKIKVLDKRLRVIAREHAPALLDLFGCGELSAVKLLGEVAGITRFASQDKLASHAGVAPIPVWSGSSAGRVRLSRSGNRQINTAVHRIAITQIKYPGSPGRVYYDRKIAEGKTTKGALRCLKRQIINAVFTAMTTDDHARHATPAHRSPTTECMAPRTAA